MEKNTEYKLMILDIKDRQADINEIQQFITWSEEIIRSVCLFYHDHSNDKNSYDNIIKHKKNIEYRMFSAVDAYIDYLVNLNKSETDFIEFEKEHINRTFMGSHPMFEIVERRLSGRFDSIVYHISSIFDYLANIISYMFFSNKERTVYWSKLVRTVRGEKSKFKEMNFAKSIDGVDKNFVQKLYDYRSRLIHYKRDQHDFKVSVKVHKNECHITTVSSDKLLKIFGKEILIENNTVFTLTYLTSWLIRNSIKQIESILDSITSDLEKDNQWPRNLTNKSNSLNLLFMDPKTNIGKPISVNMIERAKIRKKEKFRGDIYLPL